MRRLVDRLAWIATAAVSLGFALSAARYLRLRPDVFPEIDRVSFRATTPAIFIHVLPGLAVAVIAPLQFVRALRDRARGLHRALGLLYTAAVAISGGAAFYWRSTPTGERSRGSGWRCSRSPGWGRPRAARSRS